MTATPAPGPGTGNAGGAGAGPRLSGPMQGILWMAASGLCFVAMNAIVRYMARDIPAAQSAFLRYAMGLPFLLPMLAPIWRAHLTPRQLRLFSLRGAVHTIAVIAWFYAMARIPMAEVTAINYLNPVYVTLGAALFLGERLRARRMIAVAVALLGALVVLRPGLRDLDPGHLAMLLTAAGFAVSYLLAKPLSDALPASVVVGMLTITVTLGLAPFAIAVWQPVTAVEILWFLAVAALATLGHIAMTRGFAAAPLAVTQPVVFLQLVWSVILGYALFGEAVDIWVILGGLMIVGAISFIAWREAVARRSLRGSPVEEV